MKKIAYLKKMTRSQWARALQGDQNGDCINIAGPGHSKRDRSLGIWFDPKAQDGFRFHSLADDDRAICRTHIKDRLQAVLTNLAPAVQLPAHTGTDLDAHADVSGVEKTSSEQAHKRSLATKLWEQCVPIEGTLAAKYLKARGCTLSPEAIEADALGFHAFCRFGHDRAPAVIALITHVLTGEAIGVHRTALRDDGLGKREMPDGGPPKRMLGSAKDGVVRLFPFGSCLGVAEGVETALSAAQISKMPVWAALSATGLADFPVMPGVTFLEIFADRDAAGISAARKCRRRYKEAGIGVEVRYPPTSGDDWNDHLRKEIKCED